MKKILWSILLIILIVAITIGIIIARPKEKDNNQSENGSNKNVNVITRETIENIKEYQKVELSDGILYSVTGESIEADIVIRDDYFDTTINDIYLNPQSYENKMIQIEGMYLVNDIYTFVGRYSTSNLCPYCPAGYSFMEYQLQSEIDAKLVDEKDWIKVIGTVQTGNDETSNYQNYYYLKVLSIEIMKERGKDTISN